VAGVDRASLPQGQQKVPSAFLSGGHDAVCLSEVGGVLDSLGP